MFWEQFQNVWCRPHTFDRLPGQRGMSCHASLHSRDTHHIAPHKSRCPSFTAQCLRGIYLLCLFECKSRTPSASFFYTLFANPVPWMLIFIALQTDPAVVDALFPSSAKSAPLPSPAVSLCLSIDIRIEFL